MPRDNETAFDGQLAHDLGGWTRPDMGVLRLHRRPPPPLPLEVFGPWATWVAQAADAAACPADYVIAPLLAASSVLIGHARWPMAAEGWSEPPHLWMGCVGDSGTGKSPGSDALFRNVLPEIEKRMAADFPDLHKDWVRRDEIASAAHEAWRGEIKRAQKDGKPPPPPPSEEQGPEPQSPRLREHDVTIEKVGSLLASAAPKGLMICRDELAGFILSMNTYNAGARAFWLEAYGGRPYTIDRQKHPVPIVIDRLAVSLYGTCQPGRLAELTRDVDDGFLARLLWVWPEPVLFRIGRVSPRAPWAVEALDRLRMLTLSDDQRPILVPLEEDAVPLIEEFGRAMQAQQGNSGGLLTSAFGKARGHVLRLAHNLEFLWWCGADGYGAPPQTITLKAFTAAAMLVDEYFVPMLARVYGDAAASVADRNAATLARWIVAEHAPEVYVRHLIREIRLPGLRDASTIKAACATLIEAEWLRPPTPGTRDGRAREAYPVNPQVWEARK
jgi:hypothetical protein